MSTVAVCVGDNCVDRYLPPIGRDFVGGSALNTAVHLQGSGIPTAYVGVVGDDADGRFLLDRLHQTQVDISHVRVWPGMTAVTDIRLNPEGDREFVREELGVQDEFTLDAGTLAFIGQHHLVHNTWAGRTEPYLAEFRQRGLVVSFDYSDGFSADLVNGTISLVDLGFFSLPKGSIAEAETFARQMLGRGPGCVVVTLGKLGSLAYDGQSYYQPSLPTQLVDTLGAGDTFIGIFLAGWLKEQPLPEILYNAAFSAAQTCTHLGAWLLSREEA